MTTIKLELSKDAKELRAELQQAGRFPNARVIYAAPLPSKRWWSAVSKHAAAHDPFWHAVKEILLAQTEDPSVPAWPTGLFEVEEAFPPINQDEALAILERFLRVERGGLVPGVAIHPLQWEVLSAHYCPLRERYKVLMDLVSADLLVQSAGGPIYRETGLRWPLTITESALKAMRRGRLDARLPMVRRIEDLLGDLLEAYPNLIRALVWLLLGGGAVKLVEWVLSLLSR